MPLPLKKLSQKLLINIRKSRKFSRSQDKKVVQLQHIQSRKQTKENDEGYVLGISQKFQKVRGYFQHFILKELNFQYSWE